MTTGGLISLAGMDEEDLQLAGTDANLVHLINYIALRSLGHSGTHGAGIQSGLRGL